MALVIGYMYALQERLRRLWEYMYELPLAIPTGSEHICMLEEFSTLGIYSCSPLLPSVGLPKHFSLQYTLNSVYASLFQIRCHGYCSQLCLLLYRYFCLLNIYSLLFLCIHFSLANSRCCLLYTSRCV